MALNLAENLIEDGWQLHHQLAEQLTPLLSELLNAKTTAECVNVEKMQWSDLLKALEDSTLLCLVNMPPLEGQLILGMPLQLAQPVLTKLLNRTLSQADSAKPRPLTDVERIALMQFVNLVLTSFTSEWKQVYPQVDVQFHSLADSASKLPTSYPRGSALLAELALQIDRNTVGQLRFCYPPDLLYAIQAVPETTRRDCNGVHPATDSAQGSAFQQDNGELLIAIENLLKRHTQRIEQRLIQLEKKVEALTQKRRWRR